MARLRGLPKAVKSLATKVEREDLSLGGFLCTLVRLVSEPARKPTDVRLADGTVSYLRRLPNVDGKCADQMIDIFERHSKVVYMRKNGGSFRPWVGGSWQREASPDANDSRLREEVRAMLGVCDDKERSDPGSGPTLFDKSTKNQTMRATKYSL